MSPQAANLSREDMMALGNFFAAKKPQPIDFKPDPARVQAGKKNEIPRVAGQWPQYTQKQLEDFRARRRTNDGGNMTSVASRLSDDDIENLAHYTANLY
jgi:cytochrome c553